MRSISSSLASLQQETGRSLAYQVLKEDWFNKFYPTTSIPQNLLGLVDSEIPQSWASVGSNTFSFWGHDSNTGYSTHYWADFNGNITSSAVYAANACIRANYLNGGLYYADGNTITLKRIGSAASVSTGISFSNTSTLVRRCEAVCPVVSGAEVTSSTLFFAIGVYDFTEKLGTVAYFISKNGAITRLRNIVQFPLNTPYSQWYGFAKKASNFHAIATGTDEYLLVAQDTESGRVIGWTMNHGVESQPYTIVPIDPDLADITFTLSGLKKIGDLYYLTGMFSRNMSDGTKLYYNCYFRSADGKNWSVGERAHFVNAEPYPGSFDSDTTSKWMGYGKVYYTNPLANNVDITANLVEFDISQKSSEGDTFTAQFDTEVPSGTILTFKAGYLDDIGNSQLVQIGKFAVVSSSYSMGGGGKSLYSVNGVDFATGKLFNKIPLDIQRDSTVSAYSQIVNFNNLIAVLFPDKAVATASPLLHTGLNAPTIMYDGVRSGQDGIIYATAKFSAVTAYCQQSISLVFGMSDLSFNTIIFPRTSTWSKALADVGMRRSVLTTWDQESGMLPITDATKADWASPGSLTKFSNTAIAPVSDAWYDFAVRLNGDRIQLFIKRHATTASESVQYAYWTYLAEYRISSRQRKLWDDATYCGIALSTDVTSNKEWFAQSAYGDLAVQLTEAYEKTDFDGKNWTQGDFTRRINTAGEGWDGYNWSGNNVSVGADISKFIGPGGKLLDGMAVRIVCFEDSKSANHQYWGWVYSVNTSNNTITLTNDGKKVFTAPYSPAHATLYVPATKQDIFATIYSGYKTDTVFGVPVTTNNSVAKFPDSVGGRALLTTDATVFAPRYVDTDGITTYMRSGSPTSFIGFEQTTPIHTTYDAESETTNFWDVRSWRMLMQHGRFFKGAVADQGLPADGVFEVEDELIKYKEISFNKAGVYPSLGDTDTPITWCVIPTLYSSLNTGAANVQTLTTWTNGDGTYVGDDLSGSTGYLAEIISKDSSGISSIFEETAQYHVQSATAHSVTLDIPYPNSVIGAEPGKGDILVLSGRGWAGTRKALHPYDAVVKYYPSSVKLDSFIQLKHFSTARGLYNSTATDLIGTLACYGVFNAQIAYLGSLSSLGTVQSKLASDVADFECVYKGHVFSDRKIKFNFRDYYQLDVFGSYTNSRSQLVLELHAPNDPSIINPSPYRYLECVSVDVSDIDTFSDSSFAHELRVIVKGDFIQIEFQGQLIWRFKIKEHAGQSYLAGNVYVSASLGISNIFIYIPELGDEMESHIIDMGQGGREALGYIFSERYLKTRITPDGGMFVSRFQTRQTVPYTLGELIVDDPQEFGGIEVSGHTRVSGAEIGEALDSSQLRENGYQFDMGQNRLANTVSESVAIARTLLNRGIEYSYGNPISTHFFADLEVEDGIPVYYSNPGDVTGRQSIINTVVDSIRIVGSPISLSALYSLRKSYV